MPDQDYEARLARRRKLVRRFFAGWIVIVVLFLGLTHLLLGSPTTTSDQLLKGAPQFIVLSLVVAFAVYLRQVAGSAIDLRDKIKSEQIWNYPMNEEYKYVSKKLKALDDTEDNLSVAAPFMISLAIVAASRILIDGLTRFSKVETNLKWVVGQIDLVIGLWLVVLFSVLAWKHARQTDEDIRKEARRNEDNILMILIRS